MGGLDLMQGRGVSKVPSGKELPQIVDALFCQKLPSSWTPPSAIWVAQECQPILGIDLRRTHHSECVICQSR